MRFSFGALVVRVLLCLEANDCLRDGKVEKFSDFMKTLRWTIEWFLVNEIKAIECVSWILTVIEVMEDLEKRRSASLNLRFLLSDLELVFLFKGKTVTKDTQTTHQLMARQTDRPVGRQIPIPTSDDIPIEMCVL